MRSENEIVAIKVRMREATRVAFEARAERHNTSLNAEIVAALTRDLNTEAAYGGPELRGMSDMMSAAFTIGAQREERDWTRDPLAYASAVAGVIDALLSSIPEGDDRGLALESLAGRALSRIARERMPFDVGEISTALNEASEEAWAIVARNRALAASKRVA
jgi:hypothetical protein